jgi:hypothetical protein
MRMHVQVYATEAKTKESKKSPFYEVFPIFNINNFRLNLCSIKLYAYFNVVIYVLINYFSTQ